MNIANWLHDTQRRSPQRPALFDGTRQVADYATFAAHVRQRAACLVDQHGVAPGDNLELLYAIWWIGAVAVPINAKLHPSEAVWIATDAEVRVIFTDGGRVFSSRDLPPRCKELDGHTLPPTRGWPTLAQPMLRRDEDLAWLFYTSGTTGRSKGVMLSHGNLIAMSLCYATDVDPVGADDAALYAAPTMVKRMVEQARRQGYHGEGIKTIVYGGGPMYLVDLRDAVDTFGPRLVQIYGQGESPMTISVLPRALIADRERADWSTLAASVGYAQACIEIRILDTQHQPVPTGERGEIAVRGATVMQGYWRNPEATRQALVDGWLLTGDIGFLDALGFLTLTDRSKDVIITGGSNVYPREVEEVLAQHPEVFEVCVVGEPDAQWGESVVAFVVTRNGHTLDAAELTAWFVQRMASFKKPKKYLFRDELPKNSYGKILKTDLRQWLKDASIAATR